MQAFITADWHIGKSTYGTITEQGLNSRLVDAEDVITRMIDWASNKQVDMFVMAGDIFHTNKPSPEEQLCFLRILERLEDSKIKWVRFIIGNHDYNSKIGSSHALKLFQKIIEKSNKIAIYDETYWELFNQGTDEQFLVCYYPYKGNPPDWGMLHTSGVIKSSALVCHSHLVGAVVGAEPFEIRDDSATNVSGLPVSHVWAGHFHKPQQLCDQPLAFYPGSPYAVDFNERLDVKGAVLVDVFNNSYKTVGFNSRRLYQIDLVDCVDICQSDLDNVSDSIVKVNINLQEKDAGLFDESVIRKLIIKNGAHSIASINLKIERELAKRDPEIKLDNRLLSNYTKFVSDKDYGDNAEAVKARGLEIIQRCES